MVHPKDFKVTAETTFNDLLVHQADVDKVDLVSAVLSAFKDGEPSAIKLVTQALLDAQYKEDEDFPLTNAQFNQVIQIAAQRLSPESGPTKAA